MFKHWMSKLKDNVPLTRVVMPGSHNAGTYGMSSLSCCQNGNLYEQALAGVRHFCIRLDTVKGNIVMSHGISKGDLFENALKDLQRVLEEFDTEFFIFDIREYYSQKIGPFKLEFKADPLKIDELLEKYISPKSFALTDFDDISNVTIEEIRKSGKKYLLYNHKCNYKKSISCNYICPWDPNTYSLPTEKFVKEIPKIFDTQHTNGIYGFQTQQTPNFMKGTGLTSPKKLDKKLYPFYEKIIDQIKNTPSRLSQANIISGDFMTDDKKCRLIINLNCDKNNFI